MATTHHTYLETHTLRGRRLTFDLKERAREQLAELGRADRRGVALIKQAGLNIVLTALRKGATIGGRDTPGACAIQVLVGRVRVELPGRARNLAAGEMATFEAAGQSLVALEDAAVLVTVALEPIAQTTTARRPASGGRRTAARGGKAR